eukprot:TRINITY_DN1336_c0_g1_i1.p1 TRINITY_DN1336_c0_g1~~TRINITY_DN1336_c0_g1_i1.p1  ORF type:complete len:243 (+),score=57.15 TRINITY_DN1336_c0_g1_i1:193-921(+)
MTVSWDGWGVRVPLTIVKIDNNYVTQVKLKPSPKGYFGLQIGASLAKPTRVTKALRKHFEKAGTPYLRKLVEFQVSKDALLPAGFKFDPRHFLPGQYVDVIGTSTGKGTAGAMKRWGFRGQPATHGASLSHRSLGSTGCRQDPGRVFKNKKMHGRLGVETTTVQNLQVHMIDTKESLVFLKGAVPGPRGGFLVMRDAVKKKFIKAPPLPTWIRKPNDLKQRWHVAPDSPLDPFAVPKNVLPI